MTHVALYREWRPQRFDQVAGQQHVVQTLTNAIKNDRVVHAYLFCGPRGTGKTSVARLLARALNCETKDGAEPCNKCSLCQSILNGSCFDVIEIDAASNRGIDEIRELRDRVRYSPGEANLKIYIIDEVHMLTAEAFNALLKTLEEPPAYVVFIMATTEAHKVPLTILSRCQRFDFSRLSEEVIISRLEVAIKSSGATISPSALRFIARTADGSMRDALSLLDQAISFSDGQITEDVVAAIVGSVSTADLLRLSEVMTAGDTTLALNIIHDLLAAGADPVQLLKSLVGHYRDLLLACAGVKHLAGKFTEQELESLTKTAQTLGSKGVLDAISTLVEAESQAKYASSPRTLLEVAAAKATTFSPVESSDQLNHVEVEQKAIMKPEPSTSVLEPTDSVASPENDFVRTWQTLVDEITKQKPSLGCIVSDSKPSLKGRTLTLVAASEGHAQMLLERRNLELISEMYRKLTTENVRVDVVKDAKNNSSEPLQKPESPSVADSTNTKQEVKEHDKEADSEAGALAMAQTILGGMIISQQGGE